MQRLIECGIPFIYGFAFDAWSAQETSPPGGFGGLWDDRRRPKPVVAVLDLQPVHRRAGRIQLRPASWENGACMGL